MSRHNSDLPINFSLCATPCYASFSSKEDYHVCPKHQPLFSETYLRTRVMIWNPCAFEPAISDRNIYLNGFGNGQPFVGSFSGAYSLLSFLPSLLPDDLLHWTSLSQSSDYSLLTTCVVRWLSTLDVTQTQGNARCEESSNLSPSSSPSSSSSRS